MLYPTTEYKTFILILDMRSFFVGPFLRQILSSEMGIYSSFILSTAAPGKINLLFAALWVKHQLVLSDEGLFERKKLQDYENLQPAIATKENVA